MRLTVVKAVTPVTALRAPRTEKRCRATAPPTQNFVVDGFWWNEGLVSPQDTYEAGPNVNEVLPPNPGTNILTTTHITYLHIVIHNMCIYIYIYDMLYNTFWNIHMSRFVHAWSHLGPYPSTKEPKQKKWNRRDMYHVVRKGSADRESKTSDLIWLAGLGDLGNRILCRNRWKLCGGGVGRKGCRFTERGHTRKEWVCFSS